MILKSAVPALLALAFASCASAPPANVTEVELVLDVIA
ncbi:MAG: hypothetical protein ACI9SE_001980 [Neolewinella sp.]